MLRYLVGFAIPWSTLFVWALADRRDWLWEYAVAQQWPLVAVKLVALPLAVAWFTLDAVHWWRPRRAFDPRVRAGVGPVIRGCIAGAFAVLLSAAGLALANSALIDASGLDPDYLDAGVIAAACLLASLSASMTARRARSGHCVGCGYDLAGSPGGRCPECGAVGTLVSA